jgi:hypothetical protein
MKCIIEHDPPCRRCRKANRRCVIQPKQSQRPRRSQPETAGTAMVSPVPVDASLGRVPQGDSNHWTNAVHTTENALQPIITGTMAEAGTTFDTHSTTSGAGPASFMNDSLPAAKPLPSVYSTSPVQFVKVPNGPSTLPEERNAVGSTSPWSQSGKDPAQRLTSVQQDLPV